MATVDETIDVLIAQGATAELIARRAEARGTEAIKEYFRIELRDPETNEYVVRLTVSDWSRLMAFLDKPPTDLFNLQPIYRHITGDIGESIAMQDAQMLLISLLLGVKAVKP
jgi:hypothetical protein